MAGLYGQSTPENGWSREQYDDYDKRIKRVLWKTAEGVLHAGADVILDFGFWRRAERDGVRALAKKIGAGTKLYVLQCPDEEARRRVLARSADLPEDAVYVGSERDIAEFRKRFEPVDPAVV